MDEFERSGASGAQFAAYVGVKDSTFAAWAHKRRRQKALAAETAPAPAAPKPAEPVRWWEAVVAGPPTEAEGLQVCLPGGAQVRIATAQQASLAAVLLEQLGPARGQRMLSFSGSLKICVALEPCDLRKGFNGNGAKIRISLGDNFGERFAFGDGV